MKPNRVGALAFTECPVIHTVFTGSRYGALPTDYSLKLGSRTAHHGSGHLFLLNDKPEFKKTQNGSLEHIFPKRAEFRVVWSRFVRRALCKAKTGPSVLKLHLRYHFVNTRWSLFEICYVLCASFKSQKVR